MGRKAIGPGPGKYVLPPLVGYPNHDATRYRNPQYSMRVRTQLIRKDVGPGPKYDVYKMTPFGKASPPAYSIKSRPTPLTTFSVPGPGTYKPEHCPRMKEPRPPAYSISARQNELKKYVTPGPNQYDIPPALGPHIPDLYAKPAYSLSFKHDIKPSVGSPGPAQYEGINTDTYKPGNPKYTISPRVYPPDAKAQAPGPKYLPKFPTCGTPGFSFGLRGDNEPYITPEDDMPCVERH